MRSTNGRSGERGSNRRWIGALIVGAVALWSGAGSSALDPRTLRARLTGRSGKGVDASRAVSVGGLPDGHGALVSGLAPRASGARRRERGGRRSQACHQLADRRCDQREAGARASRNAGGVPGGARRFEGSARRAWCARVEHLRSRCRGRCEASEGPGHGRGIHDPAEAREGWRAVPFQARRRRDRQAAHPGASPSFPV